jgi:regulator of sigma E protease
VEAVRGKAMTDKTQQFGFKVGLTLVTSLMVFANYNDILRLTRQWMHLG